MTRRRWFLLIATGLLAVFLVWQFSPPQTPSPVEGFNPRIAVWMGVTWSMDTYNDEDLQSLADDLIAQGVDDAYVYVSYLKAGDFFNPTYDHAADFTSRMKTYAPTIRLWAWVGIPISPTLDDGTIVANRLNDESVRQQIADFARSTVTDMGFDGFHLNAEPTMNDDIAFLQTLDAIRETLPEDARLSTTVHALRIEQQVTFTPYPIYAHHSSPRFLREISLRVDQIALMAYDSGLGFPADYRSWMAYQVEESAKALADSDVELFIGLPTSEEWTSSHQDQAEYLANALDGFYSGLNASEDPQRIDGIALYPYWDIDSNEWATLHQVIGYDD